MIAGMVLSNLLYVVGAIAVATVVSAVVLLRHRRPRSLESSIEMFSRELKALQPDRPNPRPAAAAGGRTTGGPGHADAQGGNSRSGAGAVGRLGAPPSAQEAQEAQEAVPSIPAPPRSEGAGAPTPEPEGEPG